MSREISYKYFEELKNYIIESFSEYGLEFEWKPGWAGDKYIFIPNKLEIMGLWMVGENDQVMSEIEKSDEGVLTQFVVDVAREHTKIFERSEPDIEFKLKTVVIKAQNKYGDEKNISEISPDFTEDEPPKLSVMVMLENPDYKG